MEPKFTPADIVALSKAGFTAEEINKMMDATKTPEEPKPEEPKNDQNTTPEDLPNVSKEEENFKDASEALEKKVKELEEELTRVREANTRAPLPGGGFDKEKAIKNLAEKVSHM